MFSQTYFRSFKKQALSVGFNYITEKDGIMLFRRPKRFCGINAELGV